MQSNLVKLRYRSVLRSSENHFQMDVLATGHTHVPVIKKFFSFTYLNPGSVGQPRDGDKRASYLLARERGEFEVIRVDYPIDEIVDRMKAMNFDSRIYEGLFHGSKIGG